MNWRTNGFTSHLQESLPNGRIQCLLCPRGCQIQEGQSGFCGVRSVKDGILVTYTYGKGVQPTEEVVETEAVYHYAPGAHTLSLGNLGCMLSCVYCQNWTTSQWQYISDENLVNLTPEGIIETALAHRLPVLSWTYNDPIVWHEFLLPTARLARQAGLINLFKSAFYITPRAIDELLEVMDVFSISLKSLDEQYYRTMTNGTLQPVLDGIKQVHRAGKHLEVSTLMITGVSDNEQTARQVTGWVLENLGPRIPLHFVRFHPSFKFTNTVRTPVERIKQARDIALQMGVEHVYQGNVCDPDSTSTKCHNCGKLLIQRFGLRTQVVGLDKRGFCTACGKDAHVTLLTGNDWGAPMARRISDGRQLIQTHIWDGTVSSMHIHASNPTAHPGHIYHYGVGADGPDEMWRVVSLAPGESYRFCVARSSATESAVEIAVDPGLVCGRWECLDRAHFPTPNETPKGPNAVPSAS